MTQKSNYNVYVFDRNDKYLGTIDQAPLSRARSYDLYYKGQFVFGSYFKSRLKNQDKLKIIREIIIGIETERLIKEAQKKSPKQFKILRFNIPTDSSGKLLKDVRLFNASGRRIKITQISKAKYFNIYVRDLDDGKLKLGRSMEFTQVRLPVSEKIETIKHYVKTTNEIEEEKDKKEVDDVVYTSWSAVGQYHYMRNDGTLSRSRFRKIKFEETQPIEIINKRFDEERLETFNTILTDEYSEETSEIEPTINAEGLETYPSRLRVKLEYVDPITGEIKEKWVSTTRRINANISGFVRNSIPEFWTRLAQIMEAYASRENFANIEISQIEIETEIP